MVELLASGTLYGCLGYRGLAFGTRRLVRILCAVCRAIAKDARGVWVMDTA